MKASFLLAVLCLFKIAVSQVQEKPKLVVGLVIDQMRYDYLERFYNDFSEDGFKRIMNEGFNCKNVHYNYKPTYTGPGHATIFTGVTPSVHGIVGNNWFDQVSRQSVYCVKVKTEKGSEQNPTRLLTETLADALKQGSNFQSKSFGISLKDRGAILPAGHTADGAYWFNGKKGEWESSDYYSIKKPLWLMKFNQTNLEKRYLSKGWRLLKKASAYSESWPDQNNFEYPLSKSSSSVFPYDLMKVKEELGWDVLKRVPQGNQMSADLFKELVTEEKLGKSESTDFISLSFSATDYVGHRFGVQSVEVQDTYLRLDRTLADLLQFLDEQVGKGEYVLFLTSDHGASMPIAYLKAKGLVHGRIEEKKLKSTLNAELLELTGDSAWVSSLMNLNVYFDRELALKSPKRYVTVKSFSEQWFQQQPGIAKVLKVDEVAQSPEERVNRTILGIHPNRSGDLILIEEPNWISYSEKGSTHGSPYAYDTHVPLLFFGKGIKEGESIEPYSITDIVPTLSHLLNISMSHALQTRPIQEVFR